MYEIGLMKHTDKSTHFDEKIYLFAGFWHRFQNSCRDSQKNSLQNSTSGKGISLGKRETSPWPNEATA